MKQSSYHESYGLNGSLRLTSTGETFNFQFPKGEHRLHVQVNVAGQVSDAYLVAEKIPTDDEDDPRDMRVTLIVQGSRSTAPSSTPRRAASPAVEVDLPRTDLTSTAPLTPARVRVEVAQDGMPMNNTGGIANVGPIEKREPMLSPEARTRLAETGDQPTWKTPNDVPGVSFSTDPDPVYVGAQGNTPITPGTQVQSPSDPGLGPKNVAQDAATSEALREVDDLVTPPNYGPGPENPGNIDLNVGDGMRKREGMGFDAPPAPKASKPGRGPGGR